MYHPSAPLLASGAVGSAQDRVATRFGTFLPDIHSFDQVAFGLSVNEAAVMVSKHTEQARWLCVSKHTA